MKKIHLLCNAHLDPVWLWTRSEGIAEAVSTFRVAADFCEKYDGFIFNHNEAVLYEWVEENEPRLFARIQELVKQGKWRIMGGWYLQPDCTMPSAEGFLRQIETGNAYFKEKFGVTPTTAINFDPFGHTRGLVQILKKTGYDSYIYMRPGSVAENERDFIWEGYDGSKILCHALWGGYNSARGKIAERIDTFLNSARDGANLLLWGVGNHGGGPSETDLKSIDSYIKEHPEIALEHSYCENYFSEIDTKSLNSYSKSLVHCMVGCYTTMTKIKQNYRALENELITCEKILALSGIDYDEKEMKSAEKALLFCQFHDILPGTMIKEGEEEILRLSGYGREIANRLTTKAFFSLCRGQKKAVDGEIPVFVFNPHPYPVTREIQVEFQLADQNWNENQVTLVKIRDENGNYLPCQNEKESSSLNLDWRKRICFRGELMPMSINRFDCELEIHPLSERPIQPIKETPTHFVFENGIISVLINKTTGMIDKYQVNGKNLLKENSGKIHVYSDNEDPWGMTVDGFYDKIGEFTPLSKEEANDFSGCHDAVYDNVRIIENGHVRTKIQATFKNRNSFAVVIYTLPKKDSYIDIDLKIFANDVNTLYKLSFVTDLQNPEFIGQSAYGRETLLKEEKEVTYQKWCALKDAEGSFAVINNGTYGGSAKDNILNITLMRTPVYSAHPIDNRPITHNDRFNNRIDMGERDFSYRITPDFEQIDTEAEIFNQPPFALSFFPSGEGEKQKEEILITNKKILLSCYKKKKSGNRLMRLFNSSEKTEKTRISLNGNDFEIVFAPFEAKGFTVNKNGIKECNLTGE